MSTPVSKTSFSTMSVSKTSFSKISLSALAVILLGGMLSSAPAYADRDDRRDNGPRHEKHWDKDHKRGHDRGYERGREHRHEYRHDHGDGRWQAQSRPVIVHQDVHYHFRDADRYRLQSQYQRSLRGVRHDHRPYFQPGYAVIPAYRPYITPVPVHVLRTLPPPPPGYVIGYYQGYNVVYDPATYVILTAIDLLAR